MLFFYIALWCRVVMSVGSCGMLGQELQGEILILCGVMLMPAMFKTVFMTCFVTHTSLLFFLRFSASSSFSPPYFSSFCFSFLCPPLSVPLFSISAIYSPGRIRLVILCVFVVLSKSHGKTNNVLVGLLILSDPFCGLETTEDSNLENGSWKYFFPFFKNVK